MIRKYSKYKKTEIEWIGEIPDTWYLKRLNDLAIIKGGQDQKSVYNEFGKYPVYGSGGIFGFADKYLSKSTSVLLGRKGTIDKPIYVDMPFWTVDTMYYTNILKKVNPKFFYYLCTTIKFGFYNYGSAVPSMTQKDLARIFFAVPSFEEQNEIAQFLDTKTQAIEKKISLLSKKADYYKELRKSIINNAVCKGLDKNVKMKESGIDWIGEIPAHWEVKRLKDMDKVIMGQSPNSDDYNFEFKGYPFLQGNAEFGSIYPSPSIWCEVANKVIQINDILLSVRAPIGAVNIANQKFGIGRGLCAIRAKKSNYKFLYYNFIARNANLNSFGTGTTYIAVSLNDIINLPFAFAPLPEQMQIAIYLDEKTQKTDTILTNIGKQIETLKELRRTLINDAVTGKIKVTNN